MPLRPGQVQPEGWLRDWCQTAADGLAGRADQLVRTQHTAVFTQGWKGVDASADSNRASLFKGEGWQTEQSAYWYDGMLRLGFVLHDEALIAKAKSYLDPILEQVAGDENIFLWWTAQPQFPQKKHYSFEIWGCAVLGRAMTAYYAGTGDARILRQIEKAYSNTTQFSGIGRQGVNAETILEACEWGADPALGKKVLERSGFLEKTVGDWMAMNITPMHGVSYNEASKLPAVYYPYIGNPDYIQASVNCYDWAETYCMQPHGIYQCDEHMKGTGAFRGTETCNITDYIWSNLWILRVDGNRRHGDRIERAFLNAAPNAVSSDFKSHCYFQIPNRFDSKRLGAEWWLGYGPSTAPLCCTGNLARMLPNYVMHMWMATQDDGLAWTLYGPCKVQALAGGNVPVTLTGRTSYPFEETIRLDVAVEKSATFPLYLRIPQWCSSPALRINSKAAECRIDKNGFVKVSRTWNSGDTLELHLPMHLYVKAGHETDIEIRKPGDLKETSGTDFDLAQNEKLAQKTQSAIVSKGSSYVSVYYGPLLMALPLPAKDANTPIEGSVWQVALNIASQESMHKMEVQRKPMPARWDWPYDAPLAITVPAIKADWGLEQQKCPDPKKNHGYRYLKLPASPLKGQDAVQVRLVPYGCAKYHISMFPFTETMTWAFTQGD
jgi:hypothetical protein